MTDSAKETLMWVINCVVTLIAMMSAETSLPKTRPPVREDIH